MEVTVDRETKRAAGRGPLSGSRTTVRPRHVTHFRREVLIARSRQDVFDFCLRAENVEAILPDRIEPSADSPLVGEAGGVYEFRHWMRALLPVRWVVLIDRFEPGHEFVDHQLRGSFRWFRHTHSCLPGDGGTLYRDSIEFATLLGRVLDQVLVLRELDRLFTFRQRRMRELLEP